MHATHLVEGGDGQCVERAGDVEGIEGSGAKQNLLPESVTSADRKHTLQIGTEAKYKKHLRAGTC